MVKNTGKKKARYDILIVLFNRKATPLELIKTGETKSTVYAINRKIKDVNMDYYELLRKIKKLRDIEIKPLNEFKEE